MMLQYRIVSSCCKIFAASVFYFAANYSLAFVPSVQEPVLASESSEVSGREILATDEVGAIGGEFRVSESGAATYNVPIELPVGTAGVAPTIAVAYSSQSGNGSMGKGWSLSGLSAISRCRQTLHIDKQSEAISWTNEDRFCLNGQRLVPENFTDQSHYGRVGLVYRTEIDRQVRITSVGGVDGSPDYFIATGKDGSTTIFGAPGSAVNNPSEDAARTESGAITNKVLTWAISRFEDSIGNPIRYNYLNDGLGQRIISIEYAFGEGNNPEASIEFEYTDKAIPQNGYVAGYLFRATKKLSKISIHNNQDGNCTQLYEYLFNYLAPRIDSGLERLSSLKKCLAGGNYCLPATTFNWSEFDRKIPETYESQRLSSQKDRAVVSYRYGDVNGDGKQDLIWLEPDWDGSKIHDQYWHVKMDEGDSLSETDTQHYDSGNMRSPRNWDVIDYNADGRTDLIIRYSGKWYVYLSTPQPGGKWEINGPGIATPITEKDVKFFDVNGDGLTDAIAGNVGEEIKVYRLGYIDSSEYSNNTAVPLTFITRPSDRYGTTQRPADRLLTVLTNRVYQTS